MTGHDREPNRPHASPALFLIAAGVYGQRDGKILLLQRAVGAMVGFWSMPGGLVEAGETPEKAARRELFEETGLRPTGPLTLIGVTSMHVYGHDCFRLVYAGDCAAGEVVLSHEHTAFQWLDPVLYRQTHLSDEDIVRWRARSAPEAALVEAVRTTLDEYIAWCVRQ